MAPGAGEVLLGQMSWAPAASGGRVEDGGLGKEIENVARTVCLPGVG